MAAVVVKLQQQRPRYPDFKSPVWVNLISHNATLEYPYMLDYPQLLSNPHVQFLMRGVWKIWSHQGSVSLNLCKLLPDPQRHYSTNNSLNRPECSAAFGSKGCCKKVTPAPPVLLSLSQRLLLSDYTLFKTVWWKELWHHRCYRVLKTFAGR